MKENILIDKSIDFAARIIKLRKFLEEKQKEHIISKQIVRSGTSIGANIAEAEAGISKKDFLAKMYIALKECCETEFWLDIMHETQYVEEKTFNGLMPKCAELKKMLGSITKSTKESLGLPN